jgi:hypothetical protein
VQLARCALDLARVLVAQALERLVMKFMQACSARRHVARRMKEPPQRGGA